MGFEEIRGADVGDWFSQLPYEEWGAIPVVGPRPSARYKHAAAFGDDRLYVYGGSRNGRYLSDIQAFDFGSLAWYSLKPKFELDGSKVEENGSQESLPATSDHSMVKWGNKLLLLSGHSKASSDSMIVYLIDLETQQCHMPETSGKSPSARGGYSATLVGSSLVIFGGEDRSRKLLNDIHTLNLETLTWELVQTMQTPPSPRFDHTAAVHAGRYLVVFGGCSHSIFFNDLHMLDLQTMEWTQPEIRGDLVNPRAGHAGITIDENWYIVGGGDNKNGSLETLELNMSKLAWSTLTSVKERHPLASEGLSVCSALIKGENYLVAFGGYNGKYTNEVFVMRLKPRNILQPKIFKSPAAAAAAASVSAAYALSKPEKLDVSSKEASHGEEKGKRPSQKDLTIEIEAIKEHKKMLEVSLADVSAEKSSIREKIDEVNSTHADLSKELHSVQSQLVTERSRCFKLEAQIAELQKALESLETIENEVELLRRQKSALEKETEMNNAASESERQSSGGVWRWIAG
ncbi:Acyl-CoA-binding domain-containing protein 6 [Linum grandiflorum]